MKLLHIDSSILGDNSASRKLSAALVERLRQAPDVDVVYRDLAAAPVPPLTGAYMGALMGAVAAEGELKHDLALGDEIMAEFLAADILVLGVPMYNFTIPSHLKTWIDRLLIAGKTFRYTEQGPVGLAGGKRVLVAAARGGVYSPGAPAAALDFQEPYLRGVFGFIGITDMEFVYAEGLARGPEAREQALAGALAAAKTVSATVRQAA